ncbi:MAG: type I DNA topoisomerase [Parvularculales bacterium]
MDVVIVESPAKAKTINKYLGNNYTVVASYGHVRDLPSKNNSVMPDDNFAMIWETDDRSAKRLNDIAAKVKQADRLILATDPDREGEAISWHMLEVLTEKRALKEQPVERVVFNAITKSAVLEAMAHPRTLDHQLIDAYLARRALDYLVGFTLSPVLWRKLPGSRSAGRVQSVALRLVCERELAIETFKPQEYWSLEALLKTAQGADITARLVRLNGKKIDRLSIENKEAATRARDAVRAATLRVYSVTSKPGRRHPSPPFTTSTLQQEAARKLGYTTKRTMQIAQKLYEGQDINGETTGLITYMRTDGVQIATEAISDVRANITRMFGDSYTPSAPRQYKSKAKNAQEAHEAIRPTDSSRLPTDMENYLSNEEFRLYDLIWKRTMASQMESARLERTTVEIDDEDKAVELRITGSVVAFDGFLRLYQEGQDDGDDDSEQENRLPKLTEGESLTLDKALIAQHFTEPPPRFTEATLVKRLEELGIGRPSTYASTLSVLRDRNYVRMDKTRFIPEDRGRLVTAFLESFFERYVEYDFTAALEEKLDKISAGEMEWKQVLEDFWREFTHSVEDIADLRISEVLDHLNDELGPHVFPPQEEAEDPRQCPQCNEGRLSIKVGRYGVFVGCSRYPDCRHTRPLTTQNDEQSSIGGDRTIGRDEASGLDVFLKTGRFGPYVQLGEVEDDNKPKRAGIPRGIDLNTLDLKQALDLLSLPRELGMHPETGKIIKAGLGRYGPFVLHNGVYASLPSVEEVFTVGLNRAVTLLAEKKPRSWGSKTLRELGEHPDDGAPVNVMEGRYGPYVKHGKINATLPHDTPPKDITLEQALSLIAAKAVKGITGKRTKKAATKKKTTAKKKTTVKKKTTTNKVKTTVKRDAAAE